MDTAHIAQIYAFPELDRPWLRTNFVTTLDGAAFGLDGKTASLGGPVDVEVFAVLRSLADLILVGAGTARTEGYQLPTPEELHPELRTALALAPVPTMALASLTLDIPEPLNREGTIVVTTEQALEHHAGRLATAVDVVCAGRSAVDWTSALAQLADRGYRRINCEGGPTLHGALIDADLVDEACVSIDPSLAAGFAPRISHSTTQHNRPMRLRHVHQAGDLLLTRYERAR